VFWLLMLAGGMLVAGESLWGERVLLLGIAVFSVTVLCQLLNLPIECEASTRTRHLARLGCSRPPSRGRWRGAPMRAGARLTGHPLA
jgi:Zn-dependent membrane protease YugP